MRAELETQMTDALAAYRLTRLVTRDTITRPLRARIIAYAYKGREQDEVLADGDVCTQCGEPWLAEQCARLGHAAASVLTESEWDAMPHDDDDAPKLAALIICPYCVGMYISFGVVLARRYASRLWEPVARALALSAVAALIAGLEDG